MWRIILFAVAGVSATWAGEESFINFIWQGGRSPYRSAQVTINAAGTTDVTLTKREGPAIQYTTTLSRDERDALHKAVRAAEFFTRPEADELRQLDGGLTTLTIRVEKQERTLSCAHCTGLEPVTTPLWQLVAQAEAIRSLERNEDIDQATGVVNPQLAGRKALQPARLREPLLNYVQTHADRQRVEWALTAVAWVTTPAEYAETVAAGLKAPRQREVLLTIVGSHPFYGNIPSEHWRGLCPAYLAFVSEAHPRRDQLTKAEAQALSEFTQMLGKTRYQPAIPLLKSWFEAHEKPYVDASFTPLAKMGLASLEALVPYLDSAEECHRLNTIELLVIASRCGSRAGLSNPLPAEEYAQMIPVFTTTVIPRLLAMSERDASAKVKTQAAKAAGEIEKHTKQ